MQKPMIRVINALTRKTQRAIAPPIEFLAMLGDSSGTVLTGTTGLVYITLLNGQTMTVINRRVPNRAGIQVKVGYSKDAPGVLQVLSEVGVYGKDDGHPLVVDHAETHDYGGGDTTFISAPQIKPFVVLPYSGYTVYVFGGIFQKSDGTFEVLENQVVDLTTSLPVSGARYVLLEFDDTATINVTDGSIVAVKELLTLADIPDVTDRPLTAIRMFAAQTAIQRDPNGFNDFVDLRFMLAIAELARNTERIDGYLVDNTTSAPVDGDALLFDGCTQTWYPSQTVTEALNALSIDGVVVDNTTNAPTDGQVLTYDIHTDTYRPENSGGGGAGGNGGPYQRVLTGNLTLADGESLVVAEYLDIGNYQLTLQGDSELVLL